jgi:hypothetical protein
MIDTAINYPGDFANRGTPGDTDDAEKWVSAHFIAADGGYVFAGLSVSYSHVANKNIRTHGLIERFRDAFHGTGVFDPFDTGVCQRDFQRTSDMGPGIGENEPDIVKF